MRHIDIFAKFLDMFFGTYGEKVDSYVPAGKDTIWINVKDGTQLIFKHSSDTDWYLANGDETTFNRL